MITYNLIQPIIVKLSDNDNIPEHLRNHYMVNLNVINATITDSNDYMLINDGTGVQSYMITSDGEKFSLSDKYSSTNAVVNDTSDEISDIPCADIPRVYIVLTDDFVDSQENFSNWITLALSNVNIFVTGTEYFKPGIDYYINETLAKCLNSDNALLITLPNYLDSNYNLTNAWVNLEEETSLYNNFNYFRLKNKLLELSYTEDELRNLCHTFFVVLNDGAEISDENTIKTNNIIYDAVIKYYLNYQNDAALSNIALILNSNVSSSTTLTCGCQTSNSTSSIETSCYDKYKSAMSQWLVTMLGDIEFYRDWMYYKTEEGTYYPNSGLITELITLLENFETADYDISFAQKSIYNQACDNTDNTANKENHQIIKNYIQLLNWVLNGCLDNNTNKIKVIGEKFGGLLPKLIFVEVLTFL